MYVTRDGGDSGIGGSVLLTDRSSNKPIGDITVGEFPIRIAYDPANGNMYVSNRDSNSVTCDFHHFITAGYNSAINNSAKLYWCRSYQLVWCYC